MALAAGRLDRRIRLLRRGQSEDAYGDPVDGYSMLADVWAWVRPTAGRELIADAQNAGEAGALFWIRWRMAWAVGQPGELTVLDRIEYPRGSGRQYDIKSINEIGRREGLEIVAVARMS